MRYYQYKWSKKILLCKLMIKLRLLISIYLGFHWFVLYLVFLFGYILELIKLCLNAVETFSFIGKLYTVNYSDDQSGPPVGPW